METLVCSIDLIAPVCVSVTTPEMFGFTVGWVVVFPVLLVEVDFPELIDSCNAEAPAD